MSSEANARPSSKIIDKPKQLIKLLFQKVRNRFYRLLLSLLRTMPGGNAAIICRLANKEPFTPEQLILNYTQGMFPLDTDAGIRWHNPPERAILLPDDLYIEKELARIIRQGRFEITVNKCFRDVMIGCAERDESWITPKIIDIYEQLHKWGAAHSVEAWKDSELAGGLYGLALGGVFVVESMFYRVSNASKVASVYLVEQVKKDGFIFLDCQYPTAHWLGIGAIKMSQSDFKNRFAKALIASATFNQPVP